MRDFDPPNRVYVTMALLMFFSKRDSEFKKVKRDILSDLQKMEMDVVTFVEKVNCVYLKCSPFARQYMLEFDFFEQKSSSKMVAPELTDDEIAYVGILERQLLKK